MRLYEAFSETLIQCGISDMFGLAGDGNLFMVDTYARSANAHYYSAVHEAGAVLMANGYAQSTKKVGVATVTHGPALTNTVTALAESVRAHIPLLLIVGDTPATDRDNLQDIQQREVVLPSGAGFEQVRQAGTALRDLRVAIQRAQTERRPIVLNVPVEFWWEDVEPDSQPLQSTQSQATGPDPQVLDEAVGMIAGANRPLILAGEGATSDQARTALLNLSERIGAPLTTTLRAKDLFYGTPWSLGVFGGLATSAALHVIMQSDCIIAFGASLNGRTTDKFSLIDKKRLIQVDIDPTALQKNSRIDLGIVSDAAQAARAIHCRYDEAELPPSGFRTEALATQLADESGLGDSASYLDVILSRIDEAFPLERTLVFDVGRHVVTALKRLHTSETRGYIHTLAFGSIGLGMGCAIGAAVGRRDMPVLFTVGDGGFMNGGLMEFNSAVRHNLDVVVLVLNDGAYGAEHIQFRALGLDPSLSTFAWPDFAPIAESLGGLGLTVRSLSDLDGALAAISRRDRPVLVDIKLDPDEVPPDR